MIKCKLEKEKIDFCIEFHNFFRLILIKTAEIIIRVNEIKNRSYPGISGGNSSEKYAIADNIPTCQAGISIIIEFET